uniref:FAD synthase n=2 Tax=Kalanchoe fedtschenkoi TaxID=63787 RepID=A0A7N0T0Z7_KALFE
MGILPQSLRPRLLPATMSTFTTTSLLHSDPLTGTTPITIAATSLSKTMASSPGILLRMSRRTRLWPNFMIQSLEMQKYISSRRASICTCSQESSRERLKCQPEDVRDTLGNNNSPIKGGIVALGKFDALHIGHRELAIQASKAGSPFLLSFVGMAEVLGWEPRPPIVANCDRKRVLSSWASQCGNIAPQEFQMEFSSVRSLTPREFVEKLVKEFGISGVVAGENYRFGYRASGDASELVRLCDEYGIDAYIINPVMDKNQDSENVEYKSAKERGQVSSTRVRYALDKGDMSYVSKLLGRQHRLIVKLQNPESQYLRGKQTVSVPKSCLLNLPPREGRYDNCYFLVDEADPLPCGVSIDSDIIRAEFDDEVPPDGDFSTFGIEFGTTQPVRNA